MVHYCFKESCEHEAQYLCLCMSSETYCCKFHLEAHIKLPNRTHAFDSVLHKPCEWTKDEVLGILTEEKSKKEKLKQIVLAVISQIGCNTKKSFEESIRLMNSDLKEIDSLSEKVCQIPKQTECFNTLILQPDTEKAKILILKDSELYNNIKLFYKLSKLRYSTSNILNRVNNDPETEQYFRKTCKKYENYASDPLLSKAYQELINAYEKLTSHYTYQQSNLTIYSTIKEKEKNLIIPNLKNCKCITKLPNGKLFCFNNIYYGTRSLIVDKNYGLRILPSEMQASHKTIAIYFNRSVYCFEKVANSYNVADIRRFDLDKNRWIKSNKIASTTTLYDIIVFKGNFLISQSQAHLLIYSSDIDSFSEIPYTFSDSLQKQLINLRDKLYLIDWGKEIIYESDDEYSWTKAAIFSVKNCPIDTYYSYNKGGIYISSLNLFDRRYFKFDLNKKALIETIYYDDDIALRKVGDELKEIKIGDRIFKFDTEKYTACINKGYTLYNLSQILISIEDWKRKIRFDPKKKSALYYTRIERALKHLDNDRAIKYFNKKVEFDPNSDEAYFGKGHTLHNLNRHLEALACYNRAIKLNPHNFTYIWCRAILSNDMGQEEESVKDFNKVYEMKTACFDKLNSDDWDFIETLYKFQESEVEIKREVQRIKKINKNNQKFNKKIEEKEKEYREQHLNLLKRAIFWLTKGSDNPNFEMQLIRNEMNEHLRSRESELVLLKFNLKRPLKK